MTATATLPMGGGEGVQIESIWEVEVAVQRCLTRPQNAELPSACSHLVGPVSVNDGGRVLWLEQALVC